MKPLKSLFYKPLSLELTVSSSSGFHLRPAARFAAEAKQFECDLHIEFSQQKASAKAVNAILSLGLDTSDTFTLIAYGKDAKKALEALEKTFHTLMETDSTPKLIEKQESFYEGTVHECEIIAEGIAVGTLHPFSTKEIKANALSSFKDAVEMSVADLDTLYLNSQKDSDAHIFTAQKALLLALTEKADSLDTFTRYIEKEKETLKQGRHISKIADLNDLIYRVKTHMGYRYEVSLPKHPFILIAEDLLPSHIKMLERSTVLGVVLLNSTLTSHTAILLRASGIPSLLLNTPISEEKEKVILDAYSGVLVFHPSQQDFLGAFNRKSHDEKADNEARNRRFEAALTKGGTPIGVFANVADVESAKDAKDEGAEGIGLLRSEFLFKENKPAVREQVQAYKTIFELFEDVTVRTLDVGGDKALPYISLPKEQNPFLGLRGIRLIRTHRKLIEEELEAIFLAAQNKPVNIMFPMISTPEEFVEAKNIAIEVAYKKDIVIDNIRFGIMVEVPSVLFAIERFNALVDFYSIGTNDLAQYLFAIERTHPTLKIDPLSPILFAAIQKIVREADKPVSICGELASDPKAIPKLLEIGVTKLSVSPKRIAKTKEKVRNV